MHTYRTTGLKITIATLACMATMLLGHHAAFGRAPEPCAIALAAHVGQDPIDQRIVGLQATAQRSGDSVAALIRLGWAFADKARLSFDPGFYTLAEQAALCALERTPDSPDAMLLRGHARHSVHDFKTAESLARDLVQRRGAAADHTLLGDTLIDQGVLAEAEAAYRTALRRRPGAAVHARLAHLRWLQGDLESAIAQARRGLLRARNPGMAVWLRVRLALLELQAGRRATANRLIDRALTLRPDHAPALLARGRLLLADGQPAAAVSVLRQAAGLDPTPEYRWALIDALRAAGETEAAAAVESAMLRTGAAEDRRTVALYLTTVGRDPDTAVRLARAELEVRKDVHTLDALAWALAAAGRLAEAHDHMTQALSAGTADARLWLHAGIIAAGGGDDDGARRWLDKARASQHMLLPSEQQRLAQAATTLPPPLD